MITEKQLRDAAFWEVEGICLGCGEEAEASSVELNSECSACSIPLLVNPALAVQILDNIERDES